MDRKDSVIERRMIKSGEEERLSHVEKPGCTGLFHKYEVAAVDDKG